jgi:hypothetical protein
MSRVSVKKCPGVFFRERKVLFNGRPDKTFEVCWQRDGKKFWKTIGRLSDGVTAADAAEARRSLLTTKPASRLTLAEAFALNRDGAPREGPKGVGRRREAAGRDKWRLQKAEAVWLHISSR